MSALTTIVNSGLEAWGLCRCLPHRRHTFPFRRCCILSCHAWGWSWSQPDLFYSISLLCFHPLGSGNPCPSRPQNHRALSNPACRNHPQPHELSRYRPRRKPAHSPVPVNEFYFVENFIAPPLLTQQHCCDSNLFEFFQGFGALAHQLAHSSK